MDWTKAIIPSLLCTGFLFWLGLVGYAFYLDTRMSVHSYHPLCCQQMYSSISNAPDECHWMKP